MFKVLIVDDEVFIREGLAGDINWQSLECEQPALAENGLEAVEIIRNSHFDIVITDVKMPGMNGLELAEWIYRERENTYVIILSGYDDFKFAQSALSFGVKEYMLKPTKIEELESTIEKIKKNIRESKKKEDEYFETKKIIDRNNQYAFINRLIFNLVEDGQRLESILKDTVFNPLLQSIAVIQIYDYSSDFIENAMMGYIQHIQSMIEEKLSENRIETLMRFEKCEFIFIFYTNNKNLKPDCFSKYINSAMQEVSSSIKTFCPFNLAISISKPEREVNSLKNAYYESLKQCEQNKLKAEVAEKTEQDFDVREKLGIRFFQHIKDKNVAAVNSEVDRLFELLNKSSISHLKTCAIQIINHVTSKAVGSELGKCIDEQRFFSNIIKAYEKSEIVFLVKDALRKVCSNIKIASEDNCENIDLTTKIIDFIKKNFHNDLTVEIVADRFYISSGHLSRLLKKNYNMTFLDILTKVRIENAKLLLKNPRYKAYEVGIMVGFKNPKYFSQVFKRYSGKTPVDFK